MLLKQLLSVVIVANCCASAAGDDLAIFYTAFDGLHRNVRGTDVAIAGGQPWGIAVDPSSSKVYWTDLVGGVKRANFSGAQVESLFAGLGETRGIDLDLVHGKMYWIEQINNGLDIIYRANLNGSSPQALFSAGYNSFGVAVDAVNGKVYWTDAGANGLDWPHISRADLDGKNIERLVNTGVTFPFEIAVDAAGGKMYWADAGLLAVKRANLNGLNVETLASGIIPHAIDLDLAQGKLYWGETRPRDIVRANLNGTNLEVAITISADQIQALAVAYVPEPSGLLLCYGVVALLAMRQQNAR